MTKHWWRNKKQTNLKTLNFKNIWQMMVFDGPGCPMCVCVPTMMIEEQSERNIFFNEMEKKNKEEFRSKTKKLFVLFKSTFANEWKKDGIQFRDKGRPKTNLKHATSSFSEYHQVGNVCVSRSECLYKVNGFSSSTTCVYRCSFVFHIKISPFSRQVLSSSSLCTCSGSVWTINESLILIQ